ncbi:hypothetical protein Anas_10986 [Armadillidium nasatum]|uniref:Uncharacterized protein n=1 Tax=Armadillidium nasatum TaxID=96803 RepID=A0A5N5T2W2_9CRUS|nr:hypothetical protein Anas_10986 [Armadillidium nasatum]
MCTRNSAKIRRERNKLRKERQKEEEKVFDNITGIGFDGRRDATLQISEVNGKYYTSTILEDHYVITGEPGDFYLDHFSPESGKGIDIAHGIYKKVCGTELENRLSLVKADGTNVNTGHRNGSIRYLEMFLGKPLQHDICLLHLNELPLRHVFMKLDAQRKVPISNETLDSLSTDQYYAYRICCSIITGDVDDDLALLEVGPINHSRWLTLACRILRYYASLVKPSLNEIFTCEDDFEGGVVESESEDEPEEDDETKYPPMNKGVRTFLKPKINFNASSYHTMTPISQWETIPPILNAMSEAEIKNLIYNPLKLRHDCHSQNVERHIKLVTEASLAVVGHDRRDGLIRNKIRSRKLMKTFVSKMVMYRYADDIFVVIPLALMKKLNSCLTSIKFISEVEILRCLPLFVVILRRSQGK